METLTTTVDYSLSLGQMILAANFGHVNSDITPKSFKVIGSGVAVLMAELFHLEPSASHQDVVREMEKVGFRPANIEELIAYGTIMPDEQWELDIIGFGSIGQLDQIEGRWIYGVPRIFRASQGRELNLTGFGYRNWSEEVRFLGVRVVKRQD
jgi:hypothetical protein